MNKIICSLNFMYSMERFATAIYRVQRGSFKEAKINEKMNYAVDNEWHHASNLKNRIIELNNTPSSFSFLFKIVGTLLGFLNRCSGKMFALKIDVVIEKRAVKDYSYFLRSLKLDDKTRLLMKGIIADEEQHINNWEESIEIIKGKTPGKLFTEKLPAEKGRSTGRAKNT